MIILDTDHFSVLTFGGDAARSLLRNRIDSNPQERFCVTIISFEESARGWLARIRSERDFAKQGSIYQRLMCLFEAYSKADVLGLDDTVGRLVKNLLGLRVRIGTQDLKIASIALAHDATLLTANARDFSRVPGLRFENWLSAEYGT